MLLATNTKPTSATATATTTSESVILSFGDSPPEGLI